MTKKVFNLIVLDESGSMCGIVNATLSGLNETLQSIRLAQEKHPEQEHFVTLMSFNSEGRKFHYDCTPAKETGFLMAASMNLAVVRRFMMLSAVA